MVLPFDFFLWYPYSPRFFFFMLIFFLISFLSCIFLAWISMFICGRLMRSGERKRKLKNCLHLDSEDPILTSQFSCDRLPSLVRFTRHDDNMVEFLADMPEFAHMHIFPDACTCTHMLKYISTKWTKPLSTCHLRSSTLPCNFIARHSLSALLPELPII